MVHRPSASPAGQKTTAGSCSPPVRLGRPPYISDTCVIIHDLLWADIAKNNTGRAENDCGVSDTNIIYDLLWTDLAKDRAKTDLITKVEVVAKSKYPGGDSGKELFFELKNHLFSFF